MAETTMNSASPLGSPKYGKGRYALGKNNAAVEIFKPIKLSIGTWMAFTHYIFFNDYI